MSRIGIKLQDIYDNIDRLAKNSEKLVNIRNLDKIRQVQADREIGLLATTTPCAIPKMQNIRDNISGLEINKLQDYLNDDFYNADVMTAMMCTTDSLIYVSPDNVTSDYFNNHIRQYITNLRQIGAESVEGYAMVGNLTKPADTITAKTSKDLFVIKSPRREVDALRHELVVGLFGTNKLRKFIPNFAYIYGGFKCSPPIIDPKTKEVISFCSNNENAVSYIIYENINPNVTSSLYTKTCSAKEFLNMYMQIVYALRKALIEIHFTHYDLHNSNVLIRRVPSLSKFQIKYDNEYLSTDCVATIIDYGRSHIVVDGKHFGLNGYDKYSIFAYQSWIMTDLYNFLTACMISSYYAKNNSVFDEAAKIFHFFIADSEDPHDALDMRRETYASFPHNSKTINATVDDLIIYIKQKCDCSFITDKRNSFPLLDCEKICASEQDVLTKLNLTGAYKIPDNIAEFYDLSIILTSQQRDNERREVTENFLYHDAMSLHEDKVLNMTKEVPDDIGKVNLIILTGQDIDTVMDYVSMVQMRESYLILAKLLDKTIDYIFQANLGIVVAEFYQDNSSVSFFRQLLKYSKDRNQIIIDNVSNILLENRLYLTKIRFDPLTSQYLKGDSRLNWYFTDKKMIDSLMNKVVADFKNIQ